LKSFSWDKIELWNTVFYFDYQDQDMMTMFKVFYIRKIKILNRGFSFVAKTSGQINIQVSLRLKACLLD